MRVSRLSVQGFKSFSARAELELGPGITAIVGPNGSGKSNLVDAIRLVLGETSARELRGQRLEQVIFAGGAKRAPQGMAEVTLVFDNEDGRLPVEDVEVAITRRVFRDGASEFRRNGQRVRLRDLGRLLDATGLAQAGYAVIAQNDIESIIRASPAQRRHLVEEAAGVRGAQALLDDARARLASLAGWLDGSMGRLAELLPRIEALRQEAVTAREAADIRSRLDRLRGSLERGAWLQALAELRRLERQEQAAQRRLEQAAERVEEFEPHYQEQRRELQAIEAGRLDAERQAGRLALERQQAEAELERWQERVLQAADSRAQGRRALGEADEDLGAMVAVGTAPPGQPTRLEEARLALSEAEAAQSRVGAERGRCQTELGRARSRQQELEAALAATRRRQAGVEARAQGIAAGREQSAAAIAATEQELARDEQEERQAEVALRDSQQQAARLSATLERALRAQAGARQLSQRAEQALTRATVSLREAEARLAAHGATREGGRSRAPIATAAAAGRTRLRALADGLQAAQAEDAAAVEAGLGIFARALVGDEPTARQALALAGEVPEVVCWPLPEEPAVANPPEGCRPLATTVVGEAAILAVVARVCRLVCLAADQPAAARWLGRLPDGRAVLPDGSVVGTGLQITPAGDQGALLLAEEGRAARRTVELQRQELVQAELAWKRAEEAQLQAQQGTDHQRSAAAAAAAEVVSAQHEQERRRGRLLRAQASLAEMAAEQARGDRQAGPEAQARAALEQELESLGQAGLAAGQAEAEARAELLLVDQRYQAGAGGLERLRAELAGMEAQAQAEERSRDELQRRRAQLEDRRRLALGRVAAAEAAALEALLGLARARGHGALAQERWQAADAERDQRRGDSDPLQRLGELERARAELEAQVSSARGQLESLGREQRAQAEQVEQLRGDFEEASDGRPAAQEPEMPEDPGRAAAELARDERRLRALGPVNELAPAQLEDLLARTSGLRAAHDDCQGARTELEQVLGALQDRAQDRFLATFEEVAAEFSKVWGELFGGGRAELLATSESDAAGAGVEMRVQPQGKRAIPMALLSGGERALTALAMVLALQQVSPSPFYVFDEVDAALDEANIAHFAHLLEKRARHTQFLVVTHSLTTMARADLLYGVTQDGDGSSRILSVRLDSKGEAVPSLPAARLEVAAIGG